MVGEGGVLAGSKSGCFWQGQARNCCQNGGLKLSGGSGLTVNMSHPKTGSMFKRNEVI